MVGLAYIRGREDGPIDAVWAEAPDLVKEFDTVLKAREEEADVPE